MDYKQYILELLAPVGEALKLDDPYPTLIERLKKCDEKCTEAMKQEQQRGINAIIKIINIISEHYSIDNLSAIATKILIQELEK